MHNFHNWVDLVTVHASVTNATISKLSGVLLVANMSNNNYDLSKGAINLAKENPSNIVGFITQYRINCRRFDLYDSLVFHIIMLQ